MGTKSKPGAFDCYEKAEADEPMFILLARDPLAASIVRLWCDMYCMSKTGRPDAEQLTPEQQAKVTEAWECASEMDRWRYKRQ